MANYVQIFDRVDRDTNGEIDGGEPTDPLSWLGQICRDVDLAGWVQKLIKSVDKGNSNSLDWEELLWLTWKH